MAKKTNNKVLAAITRFPIPYIIITIVAFGIYFQAIYFGFIHFDDDMIVKDNLHNINKLSTSVINEIFHRDAFFVHSPIYYRPLFVLSLVVNKVITGENPLYFHLINIIFHVLFCWILYYFLNLIKVKKHLSLILTLIFAVHPLFINAVVWIVKPDDLMAASFILLSFIMLIKYENNKKFIYIILQCLFLLFGILSKETALITPLVFILYLTRNNLRKILERRNLKFLSIWFLLIILYFAFRILMVGYQANASLLYLLYNIPFIPEIISKFFIPYNFLGLQSFNYIFVVSGVLLMALILFILYKNRKKEFSFWMIFGFLWLIIFSLPGLLVISNTDKFGAHLYDYIECRAYIPMIGLVILLAVFINHFENIKKIYYFAFLFIFMFLCLATLKYSKPYSDPIHFYSNIIDNGSNTVVAYLNRGTYKRETGDIGGALGDFNKAIENNPNFSEAYNVRGLIKKDFGNYDAALVDFNKSISLDQNYDNPYNNRAIIKNELKDFQGALSDYNKAIQLNPNNDVTYNNRGMAKEESGDKTGAMFDFNKAIEINPNNIDALKNRGNLKKDSGDKNGAINDYNHVIELNPRNIEVLINRGTLKNEIGDNQGAINDYNMVIQLDPTNATAYYNRGIIEYNMKDNNGAWDDINRAIELDPKNDMPYNNRAILKLGNSDFQGALNDFNKSIELNPKNFVVYNNLGKYFVKTNDLKQAIYCFGKAEEINHNFTEAIVNLGRTKSMMNDNKGATEEWEKAAAMGNPDAQYLLRNANR